jgi:hypothetical protein
MTHTFTNTWQGDGGGKSLSASVPVVGAGENNKGPTVVNNGATNQLLAITQVVANMKGLWLLSNADLTIKTNSTSSPGNTINLKAGQPYIWYAGAYWSNPFTVDITAWYLTNASGQQARLDTRILTD